MAPQAAVNNDAMCVEGWAGAKLASDCFDSADDDDDDDATGNHDALLLVPIEITKLKC